MFAFCVLLAVLLALGFYQVRLISAAIGLAALLLAFVVLGGVSGWLLLLTAVAAITCFLLSRNSLRVALVSGPVFAWFRKIAPRLSDTEREALEAGTVWWDAELFSGSPDWDKLLHTPAPTLREAEQAFIDGPLEELCAMLDSWKIEKQQDLPAPVWQFLRDNGFFSLIIEKKYGGLEFSPYGNSAIVTKIASRDLTAAVTVMVPNSLGPGELLRDFGTEEQQQYYLPRLASGEDIPCFALTGPTAGSDAASMPDRGVVCKGDWQGEEVLGLRVSWNKRYITLAPVATVLGLAFQTYDPDGLLGEEEELGITCALIPTDTAGVWTGNRHFPVGSVFMNGPTRGDGVFIPMSYVIGGQARIGQGWRMLMHSLAAGRAISLPALGTAGVKLSAIYSGEYARIRKQFGMPIGYFEGIEEPLARMAGEAYRLDAARLLTLSALELGEKPGVLSAMLKYHATEANRRCVNDAMDIHAGKGIITGPGNYMAAIYQALPIAITVEGANILTRSLIIFGQGAIRNHPYLQREMQLAGEQNSDQALAKFDQALFSHIGFVLRNLARTLVYGVTGARFIRAPVQGKTAHYYRQITRMSSAFALVADTILLSMGGAFKFREKISGRMADVFIHLYLASAVLKQFEDSGCPKEDRPLVHWAMRDSLYQIQTSLVNALRNLPSPLLGAVIRWLVFPLGRPYRVPSDRLGKYTARILLGDNPARERIKQGLYQPRGEEVTAKLAAAFAGIQEIASTEKLINKQLHTVLSINNYEELSAQALEQGLIDSAQVERIREVMELIRDVINVDDFAPAPGAAAG